MANIMINEVCNLKCPYCFANKYVNNDSSTNISFKNFKKAIDWINKGSGGRIGLIGGEPTIHPQLLDLLDYAVANRLPGQQILVFSNLLLMDKYVKYFALNDISILANINSPHDTGDKIYKKIYNNIGLLRNQGVKISIGMNYYKPDMDTDFIEKIITDYSFTHLRIGITCPNTHEKQNINSIEYFKTLKNSLLGFVKKIAYQNCTVNFDCQTIPHCVYNDSDFSIINEILNETPEYDSRMCSICEPVIDILQDLKAVRCFGVSDKKLAVPIERFANEEDLIGYFRTNIDNVAALIPASEDCKTCYLKTVGKCQGGCLGFKIDESINKLKKIVNS